MATVSSSTTSSGVTKLTYSSDAADIDWTSLIEAAVTAKTAKADTIETKISANELEIEAYTTMQGLLQDLTDAALALSAPSGTSQKSSDVFLDRTAYLSTTGSQDATGVVGISVAEGTEPASYELQVHRLATAHKVAGTAQGSKSTDLGLAGVVSLGLDGGTAVAIAITEDMSLADIVSAINDESATTGIQATVLQVADGDFRLVLTATSTGAEIEASSVSGTDVLAALGVTDGSGAFANEVQKAQSAIIEVDGVTITRSSNTIDDAIDGVTLYLYDTTDDDASIGIEVTPDYDSVAAAVEALVEAYNAYREFAFTQQQVSSSGTAEDDAVLFGDGTLRSVNSQLSTALATVIDSNSMALLGLSYDSDNSLVLDSDALSENLLADYDAIQNLLAFSVTTSSSDLGLVARDTNAPSSFTLDIAVDADGNVTSAGVGGDTSLFTISGKRIKGAEGTIYEGLTFVFTGDESQSIDVTLTQGIAEKLYNAASEASDEDGGTLAGLISDLEDVDTDLQEKADDIRSRAEAYRTTLTARYAEYQAEIEAAQSVLDYLDAILQASSD